MAKEEKTDKPVIKKIGIAGAGGIGGFVTAALYDYGVNRNQFDYAGTEIELFDDDTVDADNLLHQNFSEDDIGKFKAELLADRYQVTAQKRFMTKKDFPNFDLIFSCVDSMTFRKELYNYGWEHPELIWIDGRCSSRNIGLYHSRIPRKNLESDLTDSEKRTGCLLAVDKQNKVSHVTPQIIACMMVQSFLNLLRGQLTNEKLLLYI